MKNTDGNSTWKSDSGNVFLNAEWRKLAMANYAVNPELLQPFVPAGTELDLWNGTCYVSLVGFVFLQTKIKGVKVPFHVNFEEVNLRFYVRHWDAGTWKRGVVFVKEIVPKPALTFVANSVYGEHYETFPMRHVWEEENKQLKVSYSWKKGNWHSLQVTAGNDSVALAPGSEAEFITEHYWGYTKLKYNQTSEYGVEHPSWRIYPVESYAVNVDFETVYGKEFAFLNGETPVSVFLAEGSEIRVMGGRKLKVQPMTAN